MSEREVNSPVNTRNTASKLSGNIRGSSPGAKSDPGRAEGPKFDSVPRQPSHARTSVHQEQPIPSSTPVVTAEE
jgi:hypothetical protein